MIFILTSGIPLPQAYGANVLTNKTARAENRRLHKMYIMYSII